MPFEHIEQRNVPVIESFQGYRPAPKKRTLFGISVICSLGITWLLTKGITKAALYLVLEPSSASDATFVLAKLGDGKKVFCKVERSHRRGTQAWWEWSTRQSILGRHATCLLVRIRGDAYAYSGETGVFTRVPRMPVDLPDQLEQAQHALASIDQDGGSWESFNPVGSWPRKQRVLVYGPNEIPVTQPTVFSIVTHVLQDPVLIIQLAELVTWMCVFDYYIYTAIMIGVLMLGSGASAYLLHRQRLRLVNLVTERHLVPLLYKKFVRALLARQLVPGDVIVVQKGRAACDMVLLRGACLVEESMLSGEASQTRKSSHSVSVRYNPDLHRSSTVHAGSVVQQVWVDDDEQEETLAMVVRTGEYTTTGAMLRPLIHTKIKPWVAFWKDPQTKDSATFLLLSLGINLIAFLSFLPQIVKFQIPSIDVLYQLLGTVLNALPPQLLSMLVILKVVTVARLRQGSILLSDIQKLQTAAQLDVVLFDKTGTLTVGQGFLHGVLLCEDGILSNLKMESISWSSDIRKSIALCNDLVPVGNRKVSGHADERKAFTDLEAAFLGRNTICLPIRQQPDEPARLVTLDIVHRFEFDAELMMSGVVARTASAKQEEEAQVFLKGTPHAVAQLVAHNRLPPDWARVMMSWTSTGYRVLGVITGKATVKDKQDVAKLSLANIKDNMRDVRLLGFMIIDNPVRSDSKAAIAELQQKGRLRTIMVTGDHYMTAIAVATHLGILAKGKTTVLLDMISKTPAGVPPTNPSPVNKANVSGFSRLGRPQPHSCESSSAEVRHRNAGHRHSVNLGPTPSADSSRTVSFSLSEDEGHGQAAVRTALHESLRAPSTAIATATSQQVATAAAAGDAVKAHQPSKQSSSLHNAPATRAGGMTKPTAAAALAASSDFFRSSSVHTAAHAVAAAASPEPLIATARAPSPFLASYLQSMGMSRKPDPGQQPIHTQTRPMLAQPGSQEAQPQSAQPQPELLPRAAGLAQAQPRSADQGPAQLESLPAERQVRQRSFITSTQAAEQSLGCTELRKQDQQRRQLLAVSQPVSLPQVSAASRLSPEPSQGAVHNQEGLCDAQPLGNTGHWGELRRQRDSMHDQHDIILSIDSNSSQLSHISAQRASRFGKPVDVSQSHEQSQAESERHANDAPDHQSSSGSQLHGMAQTQADKDKARVSFELRAWAREQSRKQPMVPAVPSLRSNDELQKPGRNRSLDLLRADVKNTRLSLEAANLPPGEKMRCLAVEDNEPKVIFSTDAFRMIAEGAQCIMTGFAFEHLLKEADSGRLELAVRSAVVLARMKAHQKAQLARILAKGLQVTDDRFLKGMGHTVAYCGDGINDIAALHAADLGIAIGATEAVVASPVYTPAQSVSVVCSLIKEARCSVMISFYLFKYLVLYGLVESIVGAVAFFVANTALSNNQYATMNFTATFLALAVLCTRPSNQLHDRMPAGRLMSLPVLAPLVLLGCCYATQQGFALVVLYGQSWYKDSQDQTPAVATSNLIGLFQLLLPAFAFFNDMKPHVLGFRQNPLVPGVVFLAALFWGLWDICGKGTLAKVITLETLPKQFRLNMLAYAVGSFAIIKVLLIVTRWATLTHRVTAAHLRLAQWRVLLRHLTAAEVSQALQTVAKRAKQGITQGLRAMWSPREHQPGVDRALDHQSSSRDRFSLLQQ